MPPQDDRSTQQATCCVENLVKFGRMVFELGLCECTDRQTDILITMLCTRPRGEV